MRLAVLSILSIAVLPAVASAQSGTWSQAATGSVWIWGDAANWTGGMVADGAGNTATFATAGLSTGVLINLDTPRTIGSLVFDNPTNSFGWTIQGGNPLTLTSATGPGIAVNNPAITATITAPLAGSFTKTGPGTLLLTGNSTGLTGGVTVTAGVLGVTTNGSTNPLGTGTVTLNGGTLRLGDGTGYNQRMVVPVGRTFANGGITATMDGGTALGGYTWYALGQNTAQPTTGLPMGTSVNSTFNGDTYTMPVANTTTNNALLLDATHTAGTLVVATPSSAGTISFLTSTANAGTTVPTVTATLHYTDGTPDAAGLTFSSPDWLAGPNTAVTGGRISASGYSTAGRLFDESITNPNTGHPIGSIDLSWTAGSNASAHTVIFALSAGANVPIPVVGASPAQNVANNVTLTNDSAIDVRTSSGAAVGNVSTGFNTLTVTSSGNVNAPTLKVGNVAMNGGGVTVDTGVTVLLNGSDVSGPGFLSGSGTFATAGNGGRFANATSAQSATINSNTAFDRFINFTNQGTINVAPNVNAGALNLATFYGFLNGGTGTVNIGANAQVNVSNFQSYGTLNILPGSGANFTQLVNNGTAPLYLDGGSRTFVSIPSHAGQFDAGIDLHGHNVIVAGGLLSINGYVVDSGPAGTATIVADYGSVIQGAGFAQNPIITINGGNFTAGDGPGKSSLGTFKFSGPTLAAGVSDYIWPINDAGPSATYPTAPGVAGPAADANGKVSGWSLVRGVQMVSPGSGVTTPGDFYWDASPLDKLNVHLQTLLGPKSAVGGGTFGAMSDFDPNQSYRWPMVIFDGVYRTDNTSAYPSGPPVDSATLNASTAFDLAQFTNSHPGTFGWAFNGPHELDLVYTPVPEPGTFALVAAAAGGWLVWGPKKNRRVSQLAAGEAMPCVSPF
jgi:autotransporter-associated beta strand protein